MLSGGSRVLRVRQREAKGPRNILHIPARKRDYKGFIFKGGGGKLFLEPLSILS